MKIPHETSMTAPNLWEKPVKSNVENENELKMACYHNNLLIEKKDFTNNPSTCA